MAEHVSKERSDQDEQSSLEHSTTQERQADIQREIKTILQEINSLKERFRNVESRVTEICENLRNAPSHLGPQDQVQPLPEL